MRHIVSTDPAKYSNYTNTCSCGHTSSIAGSLAFAQECAYQHVERAIQLDWFTPDELLQVEEALRMAGHNSTDPDKKFSSVLAKILWTVQDKEFDEVKSTVVSTTTDDQPALVTSPV